MCDKCDWEDALEEITEALGDLVELPERAEEFACSVQEKLQDIGCWIGDNQHVTDGQLAAISNMRSGIDRWMK